MAENDGLDLSKIVGLIMENPKLIAEISNLAKSGSETTSELQKPFEMEKKEPQASESTAPAVTYTDTKPRKSRRSELLCAMKPYLSSERAKALDSVLTIAEILDLMKER